MTAPVQPRTSLVRSVFTAPVVVAVLAAVAGIAAVLAATRLVRAWTDPYVIVHAAGPDAVGLPTPLGMPPGSSAYGLDATYMVRVDDVAFPLRLSAAGGRALAPLALVIGLLAVAALLDAYARRSTPFGPRAPMLVAVLAGAVALGAAGGPLLSAAAGRAVLADAGVEGGTNLRALVDLEPWWLAVVVGLAVLVPVLARGRRLEQAAGRSAA